MALASVLASVPDVKCCSRTDSGVHANRFCVSFKTENGIVPERLLMALNMALPRDISVTECRRVSPDFHARYSCLRKRYIYKVINSSVMDPFFEGRAHRFTPHIDEIRLTEIAGAFVGTHDFRAFCSIKTTAESTVRTVYDFGVERDGELVTFSVSADGFLYNMVRIMVGTLLNAARGKISKSGIEKLLCEGERVNLCATAPACGLYLDDVIYENSEPENEQ